MEKYYEKLLKELKKRDDIFICGSSYKDTKLRAYAYGGLLCKIPTAGGNLSMPSPNYCRWASEETRSELERVLGKNEKQGEERVQLLLDHLKNILEAMQSRFSKASGKAKERGIQNIIACSHTSFAGPDHTVICDWENSIPGKYYTHADEQGKEKAPHFDMIAFSSDGGQGVFSIIELKCNQRACSGSSGLAVHAQDMVNCERLGDWYKEYLMGRLQNMLQYQLLTDVPDHLDGILQHPERIELRKCFLFVSVDGLMSRGKISKLCQKLDIAHDFFYCFAESLEAVDLLHTHMESWETFCENK